MVDVYKYRLYCETDSKYEFVWGENIAPTTCPVDTAHSIDSGSIAIVETISEDEVSIASASWTADGRMVIAPSYAQYQEDAKFKGIRMVCSGSGTFFDDYAITTQIYMCNGMYWVSGGNCGDYVEFSIVDKDDILGLFSLYGLQTGSDVLELEKPIETVYVNVGSKETVKFPSDDVALVVPGLYLRLKYENVGPSGSCIGATYMWYEE